jgi:hypothetical protein
MPFAKPPNVIFGRIFPFVQLRPDFIVIDKNHGPFCRRLQIPFGTFGENSYKRFPSSFSHFSLRLFLPRPLFSRLVPFPHFFA